MNNISIRFLLVMGLSLFRIETTAQTDSAQHYQWYEQIMAIGELTEQNPQEAAAAFDELYADYDRFSGGMKTLYLEQRAWAAYRLGNYDQSLADLRLAMEFSKANENYNLEGIYLSLGHLYSSLDSLDQAAENYRKSIIEAGAKGRNDRMLSAFDGLAQYHQELENYDSALYYMELNLAYGEADRDTATLTSIWNNYSTLLHETGQNEKAIEYQQKAIDVEEARADSVGLIFSYANMGRYHFGIDEPLARSYIDRSFAIARALDAKDALIELYEGFSILETHRENYKEALEYFREFHNYKNELINSDMIDRVKDWQITLDNQKKDEELRMQKARTRNLIIIVSIVLVLLGWIVYSNTQIRKVKKQLEVQNQELDELNATKDKFFSIIAHDLRSPMIGLQGVGQKLEYFIRKERPEKLLEMGSKIDQSIDQLNHLLNNLLNWATSQVGGVPHHPDMTDIADLVNENVKLYKSLAESKEVKVTSQIDSLSAHVDANAISTVIRNLLSNAIKFSPQGGEVTIAGGSADGFAQVTITDQGVGMKEEQVKNLFSGSLKSSRGTSSEKGFGLGLKLCKEFVEMNQGRVEVHSTVGKGTYFVIYLPEKAQGIVRSMDVA